MLSGRPAEGVRSVLTGHPQEFWLCQIFACLRPEPPQARTSGEGARLVVAPRVLVDATAVPADRGALGRYVDGLVIGLEAAGGDLRLGRPRARQERDGRRGAGARRVAR